LLDGGIVPGELELVKPFELKYQLLVGSVNGGGRGGGRSENGRGRYHDNGEKPVHSKAFIVNPKYAYRI
jgi:hypothetical protein